TQNGLVAEPLTNFTARIVAQVVEDDGVERSLRFEIEAQRGERTYCFSVPAASFASLSWVMQHLGAAAIVYPGLTIREHSRTAVQMLSGEPEERRVYTHLGWREVAPGTWAYLHNGGAIGAGEATVSVQLAESLAHFNLPEPPTGNALKEAVRASLRLWEMGP